MKIISETRFMVVGKAEPTKSKDGKSTFWRIACMQNGLATNVSAPQEVYDAIPSGIVDAVFTTSYDDKYENFRIDGIVKILTVNGVIFDAPKSDVSKSDGEPGNDKSGKTPAK